MNMISILSKTYKACWFDHHRDRIIFCFCFICNFIFHIDNEIYNNHQVSHRTFIFFITHVFFVFNHLSLFSLVVDTTFVLKTKFIYVIVAKYFSKRSLKLLINTKNNERMIVCIIESIHKNDDVHEIVFAFVNWNRRHVCRIQKRLWCIKKHVSEFEKMWFVD
jgi:hypothetical protein